MSSGFCRIMPGIEFTDIFFKIVSETAFDDHFAVFSTERIIFEVDKIRSFLYFYRQRCDSILRGIDDADLFHR